MSCVMDALQTLVDNGFPEDQLDEVLNDLLVSNCFEDDDEKRCCIALAWYRDEGNKITPEDCDHLHGDTVKIAGEEYRVLNDDEADAAQDEAFDSMLEDEGMVPGGSGPYFDREQWKKDAAMDGRGHTLACHDSHEQEHCVEQIGANDWYFLYRVS